MVVYKEKFKNKKLEKKILKFFIFVFFLFVVIEGFLIHENKKKELINLVEINSLKKRLNFFIFKEDEKIKMEEEFIFYSKNIERKLKLYNLNLYIKTYDFFDFPFKNLTECYIPFPSAEYGYRKDSFHHAMDIQSPYDANILSTGNGIVYNLGDHYFAGKFIVIYHNIEGEEFLSVYNHLSMVKIVNKQKIIKGQKIGIIGNTGKDSSGIHLHFALYKKQKDKWVSMNFVTNSLHKRKIEVERKFIYKFLLK